MGMWNRAETMVNVWKSEMAAAVAIVGNSRPRTPGWASKSPANAQIVSPRWASRKAHTRDLGLVSSKRTK